MIRANRFVTGFVLALLVVGALSGAAAIADEGVDEEAQVEASPPAEEPIEAAPLDDGEDAASAGGRAARPRPAPRGGTTAASSSAQPGPDGQGSVEIDPESAEGACPGGTALKIDNLRSNGTFGPITISDYTNTSFTWTSTEAVSAVLVKDGGGHKTNPGGTSGSASTFGQDISHVIFCLGGDVPEVDAETPEVEVPCEADGTMPEAPGCMPAPCDDDGTMPESPECVPAPCEDDETMPGAPACVPAPCEDDKTMPGTPACVPAVCDGHETKPGRQDCNEGVAGVDSDPQKSEDEDVEAAGLVADRERDPAPAQPMAVQAAVQGSVLPLTGGPFVPFLLIAAGLVYAGGGAVLIKRP